MTACNRRETLSSLAGAALFPLPAGRPIANPWPGFKARYMAQEGRIVDTGNGGISHSEGQGYGMLLAHSAGDRGSFDQLWRWTEATLARADVDLFSWRFDPASTPAVADRNNATDGDLLIGWALLRGAQRWREPAYGEAARRILSAIASQLVVETPLGPVLLPGLEGFRNADAITLNPSYWVWPALQAFAAADRRGPWPALADSGERLLDSAAFGAMRLPTDWVDLGAEGAVAPAAGRPPRFGFDALRVPLYLAWAGRRARLAVFQALWRPYLQQKRPPPAWIDVVTGEAAPYVASPGATLSVNWICGTSLPPTEETGDYYSDALGALAWMARRETEASSW